MDVIRASQGVAFLALSLVLSSCNQRPSSVEEMVQRPLEECAASAIPNRFLIHWKNGTTTSAEASDREELIREVIEPNQDEIEFAENDFIVSHGEPGRISPQYYGFNDTGWGQTRTKADLAWARGVYGNGILVAVIDSGVDIDHPQLAGRIAENSGEVGVVNSTFCKTGNNSQLEQCNKETNGIDDDANGYIDDARGFDFYSNSGQVSDSTGHGTHVSGIILAEHASGPIKGVAPQARLLPLDFMGDTGDGRVSDAIEAIYYAATMGAKIINASWGGAPCSKTLRKAIADVGRLGVLFIAASGNGDRAGRGINLDNTPSYPAAYGLFNQITVGASTPADNMAGFSNYGLKSVNILAPGVDILSTYPGRQSYYMDGTSMATPFVAGAAALLWSARPQATGEEVRQALLDSADVADFAVSSRGRLNIDSAIKTLLGQ